MIKTAILRPTKYVMTLRERLVAISVEMKPLHLILTISPHIKIPFPVILNNQTKHISIRLTISAVRPGIGSILIYHTKRTLSSPRSDAVVAADQVLLTTTASPAQTLVWRRESANRPLLLLSLQLQQHLLLSRLTHRHLLRPR